MSSQPAPSTRGRRGGPPLLAPGLAWAALTVLAVVLQSGTRPGADPTTTLALLRDHQTTARLSALCVLASAAPLAVWVAATHHRLHKLGLRVPGPTLGLAGGLLAAAMLAVSGATAWAAVSVAGMSGDTSIAAAAFTELSFAAGGAGFVVMFGLMIAGVSVPALLGRLVPRPLAQAGVLLAAISVVAVLSLALPVLDYLLPVVRFGGLIWLLGMSAVLPVTRRREVETPEPEAAR